MPVWECAFFALVVTRAHAIKNLVFTILSKEDQTVSKTSDSIGFFWASSTLTVLAVISMVTAATMIWVMLI